MTFTVMADLFSPPPGYEAEWAKVVSEAKNLCGGWVQITVIPKPRERTLKENAYLHVLLKRLAIISRTELEQAKEYIKSRAVAIGYPPKLDETGKPIWLEDGGVMGKDSSEATVEECRLLIETCHIVASEWGVSLDD
jgi:hypothetical protein